MTATDCLPIRSNNRRKVNDRARLTAVNTAPILMFCARVGFQPNCGKIRICVTTAMP